MKIQYSNDARRNRQRAECLHSFLQHYGTQLTSLWLHRGSAWRPLPTLQQLPCAQLLSLSVHGPLESLLQLGPHNGLASGLLDSCTRLTRLQLQNAAVAGALSHLSVVTSLRELKLDCVSRVNADEVNAADLPGVVVSCLTNLTHLHVEQMNFPDVHSVSCLANLRVLFVGSHRLPMLSPTAHGQSPGFLLPACLQQLVLRGVVLDSALLAPATQLTQLELAGVFIRGHDNLSSGSCLLLAFAGLQQLKSLELCSLQDLNWPAPSAAFTTLTASPKLQRLLLHGTGLPQAVWEHVFPPAPELRAELTQFRCSEPAFWGLRAVCNLVRCLPACQHLLLRVAGGPPVALLTTLTSLTCLVVYVDCTRDASMVLASVRHIATLTTLRDLNLRPQVAEGSADFGKLALLPLTNLMQLTCLVVRTIDDRASGSLLPWRKQDWQGQNQVRSGLLTGCGSRLQGVHFACPPCPPISQSFFARPTCCVLAAVPLSVMRHPLLSCAPRRLQQANPRMCGSRCSSTAESHSAIVHPIGPRE